MSTSQNQTPRRTDAENNSWSAQSTNQDPQAMDSEMEYQDETSLNVTGGTAAWSTQRMNTEEQTARMPNQFFGQLDMSSGNAHERMEYTELSVSEALSCSQVRSSHPHPRVSQPSSTHSNMSLQPPKRKESDIESDAQEQEVASAPKRPRQSNSKLAKPAGREPNPRQRKNSSKSQNQSVSTPSLPPQTQVQGLIQQFNTQSAGGQERDTTYLQIIRRPASPPHPARGRYEDEYTFEILRDNPILEFVMSRSADFNTMNLPVSQCLILCKRQLLEYSESAQLEFVMPRDDESALAREQRQGMRVRIKEVRGEGWSLQA